MAAISAQTPLYRFAAFLIIVLHFTIGASFLADRSPGTGASVTGFPLDDTWIHMVYGRSIAHHGVPYYNTGELEAGFTSPLWLLIPTTAELLGQTGLIAPVLAVKLLGIAIATGCSLLLFHICWQLTGTLWLGVAAALCLALDPVFAYCQVSGMEVCLTAACLCGALYAYLRGALLLTGLFAAGAYWSRPEASVVLPFLLVGLVGRVAGEERRELTGRRSLELVVPMVGAGALWALYCLSVNGHPLPNTFYAKHALTADIGRQFIRMIKEVVLGMPVHRYYGGVVLYLLGIVWFIKRSWREAIPVLLIPWAFLFAVAVSRPMPDGCGTYFYWLRYAVPALPLLFIPLVAGVRFLWTVPALESFAAQGALRVVGRSASVVLFFLCFLAYPAGLRTRSEQFSWNCQNINEVQVAIGNWVAKNVSDREAVLVHDAGAIRYFGKHRTVDLVGLNYHPMVFERNAPAIRNDPDRLAEFAAGENAGYLVLFPPWFQKLVLNERFPLWFEALYYFQSENFTIVPGEAQKKMFVFRVRSIEQQRHTDSGLTEPSEANQ